MGLTYDLIERHRDTQPWTVSVVVRRAWTDAGARTDVSLDVTVPLAMFFGTRIPAPEDAGPSSK
ncbi:Transporter [Corallococcus soli]